SAANLPGNLGVDLSGGDVQQRSRDSIHQNLSAAEVSGKLRGSRPACAGSQGRAVNRHERPWRYGTLGEVGRVDDLVRRSHRSRPRDRETQGEERCTGVVPRYADGPNARIQGRGVSTDVNLV